MRRIYELQLTIEAHDEESLPRCDALATALTGALPDAWWHLDEGDPFAIRVLVCTQPSRAEARQ